MAKDVCLWKKILKRLYVAIYGGNDKANFWDCTLYINMYCMYCIDVLCDQLQQIIDTVFKPSTMAEVVQVLAFYVIFN